MKHTIGKKRTTAHSIKGFVIPTKSFVKIGIRKIFCYNNKMFSSINKMFGCCSKIFGCSNTNLFDVPNFVVVTKPFFPWKKQKARIFRRENSRQCKMFISKNNCVQNKSLVQKIAIKAQSNIKDSNVYP